MLTHAVERFFCRVRTCALIILSTILVVWLCFPCLDHGYPCLMENLVSLNVEKLRKKDGNLALFLSFFASRKMWLLIIIE